MTSRTDHSDRITRLESRMEHIDEDLTAIKGDVRQIRDALLTGQGGWKIAISLFGLAGAIIISLVTAWAIKIFGPANGGN